MTLYHHKYLKYKPEQLTQFQCFNLTKSNWHIAKKNFDNIKITKIINIIINNIINNKIEYMMLI